MLWWAQLPPFLYWVFLAVFQVLDRRFPVLHFYGNVCNWSPKKIWPRMDWFWVFMENGFFRWLHISMDWNLEDSRLYYSSLTPSFFSMFSFMGNLVCSLKMLVIFSHRNLQYRLINYSNAMQLYFLPLFVFQPIFLLSSGKTLWLLLKIINSVFQVSC